MNASSINQIAVTSDETSSWNCCIWDTRTGSALMKYKGGNSQPGSLSFIADDYLISGLKGRNTLNIWTLKTGYIPKHRIPCVGEVKALAVSPSGSHCVGAIGSALYLWKVLTGKLYCVLEDHIRDVKCIKFTDDGQFFVSGGSCDFVLVWKLFQLVSTAVCSTGDSSMLKPMHIWNLDNMTLADIHVGNFGLQCRVVVAMRDGICKVYEMKSGEILFTVFVDKILCSVIMDPAEFYLFLGTESGSIIKQEIHSWCNEESISIPQDQITLLCNSHSDAITCLSLSVDARLLLSGSKDTKAMIQDVCKGTLLHTFKHDGPVTNAFFSIRPEALLGVDDIEPRQVLQPFKFVFSSGDKSKSLPMRLRPHNLRLENIPSQQDSSFSDLLKERGKTSRSEEQKNNVKKLEEIQKANEEIYLKTMSKFWHSFADSL